MKHNPGEVRLNEIPLTLAEFLTSFNQNMPDSFPKATTALLKKFKEEHTAFFRKGDTWSLDQHRKKVMDWLPRNSDAGEKI